MKCFGECSCIFLSLYVHYLFLFQALFATLVLQTVSKRNGGRVVGGFTFHYASRVCKTSTINTPQRANILRATYVHIAGRPAGDSGSQSIVFLCRKLEQWNWIVRFLFAAIKIQ